MKNGFCNYQSANVMKFLLVSTLVWLLICLEYHRYQIFSLEAKGSIYILKTVDPFASELTTYK